MQNQITKDWQKVKLGELADLIPGFAFKSDDFTTDGTPVIKIRNIASGTLTLDNLEFFAGDVDGLDKYKINKGDILVSMTGSHISQWSSVVGKITRNDKDQVFLMNQRVGKIKPNPAKVDNNFLYYGLHTDETTMNLANRAGGSANQANISPEIIKSLEIILPELDEQRKIAFILSAFDDKIEVNNKIAKTLEDMAQALFKEWFVKFKFPEYENVEFKDSELEKIPKGWTVQNIGDICETFGGGTPSTSNEAYWQDGTINWATPTDMTSLTGPFIFNTEKKITEKGLKNSSTKLLPIDSILMTSRATVGILAISKIPICTNQGFIAVVCSNYPSYYFMFCLLKNRLAQIRSLATGSTFPEISRGVFRKIRIVLPDEDTVLQFDQIIKPMFGKIANIMQESQKLIALRDLLLPKLMKGEVRV